MLRQFCDNIAKAGSPVSRIVSSGPTLIWRKSVPVNGVTLPAEPTLASVYTRKKLTPLVVPTAPAHALIDRL